MNRDEPTQEQLEAKLSEYLRDDDYKMLLNFCVEPKEWKEIANLKIKRGKAFQIMKDFKLLKALEFANGKYNASSWTHIYLK